MKRFFYILLTSFLVAIVPSTLIWIHHTFVTGLNPFLGVVFVLLTLLIGGPLVIWGLYVLVKRWAQNRADTPAILFAMGSVCCLFAAVLEALLLGKSTLDVQMHDTYYVIAFRHIMKAVALLFGIFSVVYYWYPRWFGRTLNVTLAYIHFWITFVGAYFICWPDPYHGFEGLAGMPGRYIDYGVTFLSYDSGGNSFILIAVLGILMAQLLFVFNFFYSLVRGKVAVSR